VPHVTTSRLFKSNRSQAVRLPKAVAFPAEVREVEILVVGNTRVIVPLGKRWDDFFLNGTRVTDDFMADREQPDAEEREGF
jgi:antitoxin VapB